MPGEPRPSWVEVLTNRPVEHFLRRVVLTQQPIDYLVLVSPFIGPLRHVTPTMQSLVEKIDRARIPTYVVTNEPDRGYPHHQAAVDILSRSRYTEIRYNSSLHAKVYVCKARQVGFAMLGSGNLTETSITKRIEVAILVNDKGPGAYVFNELWVWGSQRLRQFRESHLIKRMAVGSVPNRR